MIMGLRPGRRRRRKRKGTGRGRIRSRSSLNIYIFPPYIITVLSRLERIAGQKIYPSTVSDNLGIIGIAHGLTPIIFQHWGMGKSNLTVQDLVGNEFFAHTLEEARFFHSLNLVMQQIDTQIEWVKQIYQEGEEIQMFMTNNQMSQSIFKTFSKLELLKVAETRFASHTIVMRQLLKVQEALRQMVISDQWGVWKTSHSERAQKVKILVLDYNWWARVQYVLDFTEPIMTMLRFADIDAPCLGDVYDDMDTMVENVKIVIQKHENDAIECETLCNKVESIIHHRWEKMTTQLHLLAYALSLRYYSKEMFSLPGRLAPYTDEEVANGYKKAFERLFPAAKS